MRVYYVCFLCTESYGMLDGFKNYEEKHVNVGEGWSQ